MVGVYFSGTGNSKYCIEKFLQAYDENAEAVSIEDNRVMEQISLHTDIVFSYPVQYSNLPKILKDFIMNHPDIWKGKRVFIIATMGLFSGDGAGVLGRMLKKYGAVIVGGLHIKMPDSICDEKILKRSPEDNRRLVRDGEQKIENAVKELRNGNPPQEGIGIFCHLAGLFGQRLYFLHKMNRYSDRLRINEKKCVGCGKCINICPMKNIALTDGIAAAGGRCTMCYRCVNECPKQAITLLGRRVIEQTNIKKY